MVQIIHNGSNASKAYNILDVAQKRFGSFGYEKTTMHEIATDLGMSKASLYYYYPDKESLYRAVIEKETELFLSLFHQKMGESRSPSEALLNYAEIRLDYFRTLMNLSRIRIEDHESISNIMHELRLRFREKEKEKIREILINGREKGAFKFDNEEELATLFLDALRGLSLMYKKRKDLTFFNDEDFAQIKKQIMLLVNIFIKGISKK